jgi:hypothetical protein
VRRAYLLAQALRLLQRHVRCTCAFKNGHASNCDLFCAAKLAANAEKVGVSHELGLHDVGDRLMTQERRISKASGLLALLVAGVLGWGAPIDAQTTRVGDTITITIRGDLDRVHAFDIEGRIGDTLQLRAVALDSEGDTITTGIIWTWASSDSSVVRILDHEKGIAVGLKKGTVQGFVLATVFDLIAVGWLHPDGRMEWDHGYVREAADVQGCGYLLRNGELVGTNKEACLSFVPLALRARMAQLSPGPARLLRVLHSQG